MWKTNLDVSENNNSWFWIPDFSFQSDKMVNLRKMWFLAKLGYECAGVKNALIFLKIGMRLHFYTQHRKKMSSPWKFRKKVFFSEHSNRYIYKCWSSPRSGDTIYLTCKCNIQLCILVMSLWYLVITLYAGCYQNEHYFM